MGHEEGLREEEVALERAESWYQLLVLEKELEECAVGVRVGVFKEFVESIRDA